MNRVTNLFIFLFLGFVSLSAIGYYNFYNNNYYNMPCHEFEKTMERRASNRSFDNSAKKELRDHLQKIEKTFLYAIENVKPHYPDYSYERLTSLAPTLMIIPSHACRDLPYRSSEKLGIALEKYIAKMARADMREKKANDIGCDIVGGYKASYFNIKKNDDALQFCIKKDFGTIKKDLIKSPDDKKPIAAELCQRKRNEKNCVRIEPTEENFCLSKFGDCTINQEGKCGWITTPESETCASTYSLSTP